jgi:hypothetical protein
MTISELVEGLELMGRIRVNENERIEEPRGWALARGWSPLLICGNLF